MEFYNARMYAKGCKVTTKGIMYISASNTGKYTYDWNGFNNFYFASLAAGTYVLEF